MHPHFVPSAFACMQVGLPAPPTAAAVPQASPEAAPATDSGTAGLELEAGGTAAAAAAAVGVDAPTDGARAELQVREAALAVEGCCWCA